MDGREARIRAKALADGTKAQIDDWCEAALEPGAVGIEFGEAIMAVNGAP